MKKLIALLTLLVGILPSMAWAEGAHHGPSITILWINFVIFAAAGFYFLRQPTIIFWKKRVQDLEESILKSEKELARAEARLKEVQDRSANVSKEISEVKANIAEEAKHEAARIKEQAAEQQGRILKQAEQAVASEIKAQEKSVKTDFAEKICALAKDKLSKDFSPEEDREYRTASLRGLTSLTKN